MLLLLLVSIQAIIAIMKDCENKLNLIRDKNKKEFQVSLEKEKILCNHCKRTASNGIRCLGICVADNDY